MPPKKKQPRAPHQTASREIFAANLKSMREARKMTQIALAECSGFTVSYVSMLECGSRNPPLDTLDVMARCLATSSAALITRS